MKKIIHTALIIIILMSLLVGITAYADNSSEGATFTMDDLYQSNRLLNATPDTFEATVRFPKGMTVRGGVILGNYVSEEDECINFEIFGFGRPRLYMIDGNGTVYDVKFESVNVCTGEWVHVAIVRDVDAKTVSCYIDGELKQTVSLATPSYIGTDSNSVIGGDNRATNSCYFRGELKSVAIYKDIRTAEEILSDSKGGYDEDNLMGFYQLVQGAKEFTGTGQRSPKFINLSPFIKDYQGVTDYAYSFAIIGDTQILSYHHPKKLAAMYDWIVENAKAKKMKFVIGLGDITDRNTEAEWEAAKEAITKMNGVVPYSIVRGNHDQPVDRFNRYFSYTEFGKNVDGSYDGTMCNTYQKFNVGTIKYLILNLDFGPSDAVLDWANKVVAEHPDYNVIIATHIYMKANGNFLTETDGHNATRYGGINTGDKIWDKLASKHENIVLLLSGHIASETIGISRRKGVNGNDVMQLMIDPQDSDADRGGVGNVAMLYFSNDGSQVDIEYYSTDREAYYNKSNQFHFMLDVVGDGVAENPGISAVVSSEFSLLWLLALVPVAAVVVIVLIRKKKNVQ